MTRLDWLCSDSILGTFGYFLLPVWFLASSNVSFYLFFSLFRCVRETLLLSKLAFFKASIELERQLIFSNHILITCDSPSSRPELNFPTSQSNLNSQAKGTLFSTKKIYNDICGCTRMNAQFSKVQICFHLQLLEGGK
jgi:hypothetical protein